MTKQLRLIDIFVEIIKMALSYKNTFLLKHTHANKIKAAQLSDIICRATTVSIQSANNTLTRGASSLRDTGDYAVPHPHPHTHHYMQTSATPPSLSRVGSCPGSSHGSHHGGSGSGSGSSPCGGGAGSIASIIGRHTSNESMGMNYIECSHYDRMPLPIPIGMPLPLSQMHSEDEIEPAYSTGLCVRNCLIFRFFHQIFNFR
jgi:hypothetical protein